MVKRIYSTNSHIPSTKVPLKPSPACCRNHCSKGTFNSLLRPFFSYFFNFLNASPKLSILLMIAFSSEHYLKSPHQMKSFVSVAPLSFS